MTAERDLNTLLISMKPALDASEWVFCTVDNEFNFAAAAPLCVFREAEGTTIVLERSCAEALGLPFRFISRRITLRVHSDLEAVGFLASITNMLAKYSIPANVVSAFFHDHIFVPVDRADEALRVLDLLSADTARRVL